MANLAAFSHPAFSNALFGGLDSQKLYFILYGSDEIMREKVSYTKLDLLADDVETSELNARIEKICVYREGPKGCRLYHAFVVFKTATYYYTLERWAHHVSLQRSTSFPQIVAKYNEKDRDDGVYRETAWAEGKGTVWDVIALLLKEQVFDQKFNAFTNNCQVFAAPIYNNFNNVGAIFHKYQKNQIRSRLGRVKRAGNLPVYMIEECQSIWRRMKTLF